MRHILNKDYYYLYLCISPYATFYHNTRHLAAHNLLAKMSLEHFSQLPVRVRYDEMNGFKFYLLHMLIRIFRITGNEPHPLHSRINIIIATSPAIIQKAGALRLTETTASSLQFDLRERDGRSLCSASSIDLWNHATDKGTPWCSVINHQY